MYKLIIFAMQANGFFWKEILSPLLGRQSFLFLIYTDLCWVYITSLQQPDAFHIYYAFI